MNCKKYALPRIAALDAAVQIVPVVQQAQLEGRRLVAPFTLHLTPFTQISQCLTILHGQQPVGTVEQTDVTMSPNDVLRPSLLLNRKPFIVRQ